MHLCAFLILIILIIGFSQATFLAQLEKQRKDAEKCFNTTQVAPTFVNNLNRGIFANDQNLKSYLLCIGNITGAVDHAGTLQNKTLAKIMEKSGFKKNTVKIILDECIRPKQTNEETVFQFLKCAFIKLMKKPSETEGKIDLEEENTTIRPEDVSPD